MRFTQLQSKEVICVGDGRRLGYVEDVLIELPQGRVRAVVVPGRRSYWNIFGRGEDYIIPWEAVRHVGPDIVLVDARPEECLKRREPRPSGGPWRSPL